MDKWQIKAADEITDFIRKHIPNVNIKIYGSLLNKDLIDVFSDVDMEVHVQNDSNFNIKNFICMISMFSKHYSVFGYELHAKEKNELLRICFENGWRFDISFMHYNNFDSLSIEGVDNEIDNIINQFWFMASSVLIKIGRGDYLIASHLVLELCQLVIVIQMLVRDKAKSTNVHRYGDKEDVPIISSLLNNQNKNILFDCMIIKILSILYLAAEQMDVISDMYKLDYIRKKDKLKTMQRKLIDIH